MNIQGARAIAEFFLTYIIGTLHQHNHLKICGHNNLYVKNTFKKKSDPCFLSANVDKTFVNTLDEKNAPTPKQNFVVIASKEKI